MRPNLFLSLLALCAAGIGVAPAARCQVAAGGGFDYYAGPDDQLTRSALGVVAMSAGPAQLSFTGLRYDDSTVGTGLGTIAGIGVPISPGAIMRAWGTRYFGDATFDAWRVKAGPEFTIASASGRGSLGLYYTHYEDNTRTTTDAGNAELAIPIVETLVARASGSYATSGNMRSLQGTLGAGWSPIARVQLTSDVGLAQNGAVASAPFARRRSSGLPLLGGDSAPATSASRTQNVVEPTFQFGVRLLFP